MTAVATSPIARICEVSCAASWLTLSVRSFHRPAAPGTAAWPPELAFEADVARDRRDLIGKGRERVDHAVDRVGELGDLALGLESQLALEVAVGDAGDDARDAADLLREVTGHDVDGVGQVLPGTGDAGHVRLAAELAFGADFACDARDFGGERVELVDHRIDRIFELEDLALDRDRNLL